MPRITWSDPQATWAAVARRRAVRRDSSKLGGINIATFLWSDGGSTYATTRWSESPLGTGADTVAHSEEVIWQLIESRCKTIFWVFTEREPCPPAPVGRGCSVWLPGVLGKVGANGKATPIYWIYPYPDETGIGFEARHDLTQWVAPESRGNAYVLKLAAKMIRDEATTGLKGLDTSIEDAYEVHKKTSKNLIKRDIHALKTKFKVSHKEAVIDMP